MQTTESSMEMEEQIASLLSDLADIQDQLLTVLSEKRTHIVSGDLKAMEQLQPREQALCERLEQCQRQRQYLLETAAEQGMHADSIRQLTSNLGHSNRERFHRQVSETSARTRLLQHHSLANWVLAQRSLLHVSQMLEILASGGQLQPTYANGRPSSCRGALVDKEV